MDILFREISFKLLFLFKCYFLFEIRIQLRQMCFLPDMFWLNIFYGKILIGRPTYFMEYSYGIVYLYVRHQLQRLENSTHLL